MTKRNTTGAQKKKTSSKGAPSTPTPTMTKERGGEGDYEAAERYQKDASEFARSGKVGPAAEAAREAVDSEEADELTAAEEAGRSRSAGDDPETPEADDSERESPDTPDR